MKKLLLLFLAAALLLPMSVPLQKGYAEELSAVPRSREEVTKYRAVL